MSLQKVIHHDRLLHSVIACLVVFCLIPAALAAPAAETAPAKNILIIGDSIAVGFGIHPSHSWVSLLKKAVTNACPEYRIINASINNQTAQQAAQKAQKLMEHYQPAIVIIEIGGNDGLRQYRISSIYRDIEAIVLLAKKQQANVLLLGFELPRHYPEDYRADFYHIYQDIAKKHRVFLIDFFFADIVNQKNMFQGDKIHPTEKAQPVLFSTLWKKLVPLLRAYDPSF